MNYIGTAGWSIPKAHAARFPGNGTHLERYARRLHGVEVNSSFYRDHQEATYYRWAYTTPEDFRFSVKFPRRYTHEGRLEFTRDQAKATLEPIFGLREKLGVILVQLPPKLAFEQDRVDSFFGIIREFFVGNLACEPRHPSWGGPQAFDFYRKWRVSKVHADPEPCPPTDPQMNRAGGFIYQRLHGSPEIYRSPYTEPALSSIFSELMANPGGWCIFDNTTFGHATDNALNLQERITREKSQVA